MSVNQKTENGLVKLAGLYGSQRITPNPTLAGTEDDLTGIQFGDTKYKVPSGGEVYPSDSTPVLIGKFGEYDVYRQYITGTTVNGTSNVGSFPSGSKKMTVKGFIEDTGSDNFSWMPNCSVDGYWSWHVLPQDTYLQFRVGQNLAGKSYHVWVDYYVETE